MATATQLAELARPGIRLSYPSIDDCLGPAEQRFFGSGYRRVGYRLTDGTLRRGSGGVRLTASAGVEHPHDWSVKGDDRPRRPHLTTIDAVVLGARAGLLCVERAHGLDRAQSRRTRLRRIDVRAAAAPVESGLDELAVDVRLLGSTTTGGHPRLGAAAPAGALRSTVDGRVGGMRVRMLCEHDHGDPDATHPDERLRLPDGVLAHCRPGTFGRGYAGQWQSIRHVDLDLADASARAQVCLGAGVAPPAPPASARPSAASRPASMIDSFVVVLQLGQALLYELDGVRRAETDTLWMRRATIVDDGADDGAEQDHATARLLDPALVPLRGAVWRTATVDGRLGGVSTRCAVAHRPPVRCTGIGAG